jgi:hypothetical protein
MWSSICSRTSRSGSIIRIILINTALLLAGLTLILGGFEWRLRMLHGKYDFFNVAVENRNFREGVQDVLQKTFTSDPELGFRPTLGPTNEYNQYGTLQNAYDIKKRLGVKRLLFIGDSVTHRAKLVMALESLYGDEHFEYWNAGVEGYNTVQEVGFYRKYNHAIEPDHVILTMVVNDLETTPLLFMSEGKFVLIAPNLPRSEVNGWLFKYSFLYRRLVSRRVSRQADKFRLQIRNELIDSLRTLRDELRHDNIGFSILVLPLLAPADADPHATATHRDFVSIASSLNIRCFDLAAPVADALRTMPVPDDLLHPAYEMAQPVARYLWQNRLLDPL